MTAPRPDVVRTSTVVAVEPDTAFDIFTSEIDAWWRTGPRYRFREDATGVLRFECRGPDGVGERLVEVFDEESGDEYEVGKVLAWEPGARLVFEFRARAFAPGETTEVEIRFEPAENGGGTLVSVEHRGWERLHSAHAVRHGLRGAAFNDMMGLWWSDLLLSMQRYSAREDAQP